MKSFIAEVVSELLIVYPNLEKVNFVFPSKRAGRFLLQHLSSIIKQTMFSPKIYSVEEFVEEVSGLESIDQTTTIFKFHETYKNLTPEGEQENFETFYGWSQTLMQDFNEIDRFLIDPDSIFNYLASIQDLNHWSKQTEQSPMVQNYLRFWHRLPAYYSDLEKNLINENVGYQGLQYRIASEKIESYLSKKTEPFVFVGFNALNAAEQKILQTILSTGKGKVFWDIDRNFFEDNQHSASYFLRKYAEWPYFTEGKNQFSWLGDSYSEPKNIELIAVPKNIGQAKHIGNILAKIPDDRLKNTAVVLGDETLLLPVLNSFPENIKEVNITMGIPLSKVPLASLFELVFKIHSGESSRFYHKHVVEIIEHPAMNSVLGKTSQAISGYIKRNNRALLAEAEILKLSEAKHSALLEICFGNYQNKPMFFLEQMEKLTHILRQSENMLRNESLFQFNKLFNKLLSLLSEETAVKTIKTLYPIYENSLQMESLDFSGSPFNGLQMMGMLETRVLDFETVILSSVNEGILPTGKTGNSFIPYDLKKQYGIPTYVEKDAVYAYHFYRLLQRAKNVYILYNSVPGTLNGGEKSRFILQIQTEKQPLHSITERTIVPKVPPTEKSLKSVPKTPEVIQKLKAMALHGFSPSALLKYIRNPIDFYFRYILDITETDEVEETIAANTLGTVVHNTLEKLYDQNNGAPYVLTEEHLASFFKKYENLVNVEFSERAEEITSGKNLIGYEISKRYIHNFLRFEEGFIHDNEVSITALEKEMKAEIPFETEIDFPVFLKGSTDRLDRVKDKTRIIDYKTGKVVPNELGIMDWDEIIKDYKYSKAFQVLCYAYLFFANSSETECQAGIICFKNLKEGFMGFFTKGKGKGSKNKVYTIDTEVMNLFEIQLKKLILEICDPSVPFVEKEVEGFE